MNTNLSKVEASFFNTSGIELQKTKIPYIKVSNYPDLGLITSLRFLEWAFEYPKGVISLPTGKTPEYFIKWTHYIFCLLYSSPSPRDRQKSRMPSSA